MGDVFDFEEVFDEDYLYFYGQSLSGSAGPATDLIWSLLALEEGAEILDLACGHGRITNELARRGARASGIDASRLFLDRAQADAAQAGLNTHYEQGDMRSLPWADASFDSVISWFTSFGYFADDGNRRVLSESHRVLRPGGKLLIENNNPAELLPRWLPSVVVERDRNLAIDRSVFDPVTGRASTERVIVRDGRTRRFHFSVRLFLAVELRDWLHAAGFRNVAFFGPDGAPLTSTSARMITVAQR